MQQLEKNGTDMTGGVIFPLWGFPVALCVSKRIDSGVKSFLYVHLPPLWKRGKNIFSGQVVLFELQVRNVDQLATGL